MPAGGGERRGVLRFGEKKSDGEKKCFLFVGGKNKADTDSFFGDAPCIRSYRTPRCHRRTTAASRRTLAGTRARVKSAGGTNAMAKRYWTGGNRPPENKTEPISAVSQCPARVRGLAARAKTGVASRRESMSKRKGGSHLENALAKFQYVSRDRPLDAPVPDPRTPGFLGLRREVSASALSATQTADPPSPFSSH